MRNSLLDLHGRKPSGEHREAGAASGRTTGCRRRQRTQEEKEALCDGTWSHPAPERGTIIRRDGSVSRGAGIPRHAFQAVAPSAQLGVRANGGAAMRFEAAPDGAAALPTARQQRSGGLACAFPADNMSLAPAGPLCAADIIPDRCEDLFCARPRALCGCRPRKRRSACVHV